MMSNVQKFLGGTFLTYGTDVIHFSNVSYLLSIFCEQTNVNSLCAQHLY